MEFPIRLATKEDTDEILRLARAMWAEWNVEAPDGPWLENARTMISTRNGTDGYRVLVVDDPNDPSRLISMGIAVTYDLTPAIWLPNGKMGYLQWFYTHPDFRKQGIATDMVQQFLDWFNENNVTRVQLHASKMAQSLYATNGFEESDFVNMWWMAPNTHVWPNDESH